MDLKAAEFIAVSEGAQLLTEGGLRYAFLPGLRMPPGCTPAVVDTLLCLDPCGGYSSRLYFAQQVTKPGKNLNWNANVHILGRNWVGFSWNGVRGDQHPVQALTGHLDALR